MYCSRSLRGLHFFTLVIVVVVFASLFDSGRPFSRSRSCLGLLPAFFPGGGELRRMPVLRLLRFCLLTLVVERPVRRREARRRDCRTSHCRFFASHHKVAEPTAFWLAYLSFATSLRIRTASNDHDDSYDDDGSDSTARQRESALLRSLCASIAGILGVIRPSIVPRGWEFILRLRVCGKRKERQKKREEKSPAHDGEIGCCCAA